MSEGANHQLVGQGNEHRVYQSDVNRDSLIKVPTLKGRIFGMLKGGAPAIQEEFDRAEKLVEGTSIQVPKTRIRKMGRGYVLRQQRIEPDPNTSINAIREEIGQYRQDHPELAATFDSKREDFIRGTDGVTYWVDPTNGLLPTLERFTGGVISRERYRKAKALYKKIKGH